MSNSLDPDKARHFVWPDLGPSCLHFMLLLHIYESTCERTAYLELLRMPQLRHSNATASKAYVAVTLHNRQ